MPTTQRERASTAPAGLLSRPAWVVAGVLLVGLAASVVGARSTGAAAPLAGGLSDAGPVVRWALPLVRVVHDVAAALTVGLLLLAATVVPGRTAAASAAPDEPRRAEALRLVVPTAFVWAAAGVAGAVLGLADAAGVPLSSPTFGGLLPELWSIESLRVGVISAGCAFVVASAAAVGRSRAATLALAVLAGFGVLVLGLAGHSGGSADHETAVNSIAAHLLSATVWVGGLLALLVLWPVLGSAVGAVARRYSSIALWCFVALGVSGVMSATVRLGGLSDLTGPYGLLIVVKTLLFVVLGVAGARHRSVTLDRLDAAVTSSGSAAATDSPRGRLFVRLAVGELLLMGLAFGVATALARSQPPVPETEPNPSLTLALTGFPPPPAPTALSWLTAWRVEWLFLATAVLAAGVYVAGVVRLRRRGDAWPLGRTVAWVAGWALFAYATNGVLGIYGRVSFSWHMTLHMTEAMVVPILLVLGAPVTLALRTLRPRRDGTLGPREMVLGLVHSPVLKVAGNPVFAAAFFFFSLVVFYWTGLFELALTTHTGHLLMTAHFVLAGYLFAWVLIGVDPGPRRWSPAFRLIVLFATIASHAFFGVAMITGTTLLGGDFFPSIAIPWISSPLADQQFGGGVAWAIGELPSLVLALVVAAQWFRSDRAESTRRDRRADRDGDAELAAYNERLAALSRRDGGAQQG